MGAVILNSGIAILRKFLAICNSLLGITLAIIYPPRCAACRCYVQNSSGLCPSCHQGLTFISDPLCQCCGVPFEYRSELNDEPACAAMLCGECITRPPRYSKARSVLVYNRASATLIHGLKYQDRTHLATAFARWLYAGNMQLFTGADLLVAVPLHRRRLWQRRYNQSALLCCALSKLSGIKTDPGALLRVKNTPPQRGMSRLKRLRNLVGAIRANPKARIRDKHIILVDDVMTTGATIKACTKCLLAAGARQVDVLTVARTVRVDRAPDLEQLEQQIQLAVELL